MTSRFVVVRARTQREVEAYLPDDYRVVTSHDADPFGEYKNFVIEGTDRLGSITGIERHFIARWFTSRHDAEDAACASMN